MVLHPNHLLRAYLGSIGIVLMFADLTETATEREIEIERESITMYCTCTWTCWFVCFGMYYMNIIHIHNFMLSART